MSRRTSLGRPNGVATSYGYDSLSRLLSVLHQNGTTTMDGASYVYDNAGNRTAKNNQLNGVNEQYTYDAIYQLLQVTQGTTTTESYTYDPVGNRLNSSTLPSYSYNSSNELTSNSAASYTYDKNGNTLTKTAAGNTTQYGWDFENRLASVTLPGAAGTVTFRYDPFGQRIQKVFAQGSTTTTTNYLYDGANSIEEVDQAANLLGRYTQGAGIDEPLAELRSGTSAFYEPDGIGSVTSLSGSTASTSNTYVYDAFGNLTSSTGSLSNPFQYTGRDYDSETGLRYYRARYYDSTVGRFISEDPIRFGGGSADFYSYAYNSPVLYGDPLGLAPCSAAQISDCKNKCAADGGQVMDSCSTFNINLLFVSFPVTVCHCKGRFGTCSGIRWATLQGAVDSTCKTGAPSACNPTQTCTELKANFLLNTSCAAARTCLNNECYNGGDAGHQQAAANASRAAAKCAALIAAKRCP